MRISPSNILVLSLLAGAASAQGAVEQELDAAGVEFFEKRIRPILVEHCIKCHGGEPDRIRGGLILTSAKEMFAGGDSGVVVVPGDPDASPLYLAMTYEDPEFTMPPGGRLSDREIADIRAWIEMGAPDPRVDVAEASDQASDVEVNPFLDPRGGGRTHWAYRPMDDPAPPSVKNESLVRNDVDRFILARLEDAGIEPAREADRRTLIRRLYYDMLGLPPSQEMVRAFVEDTEPGAWERLVEQVLASPHYGERWGRHWLDVARYSDSNGLDENTAFANAWRYRDWVIRAFNQDLPYDRFVTMQIAGDLVPEPDDRQEAIDNLLATGFLSLGPKVLAEPDKGKMEADIVDEQLDVLGKTFLAQTIGCARCHDHKFDPVPTRDYYAMAGIFKSTRTMASFNTVARVLERDLAPAEEIAAAKAHREKVEANKKALKAAEDAGVRAMEQRWSGGIARAMLAANGLTTTPEVREAEDHHRSNLKTDFDQWGSGVGILHSNRPNEQQFVEYQVDLPEPMGIEIFARYASNEKRPLELLVNDVQISTDFCGEATGSFQPEGMRWTSLTAEAPAGTSTIRLQRSGAVPHLDRIAIVTTAQQAAFDAETEVIARENDIDPVLLRQWGRALAWEPIFAPWRTLAAVPSDGFGEQIGDVIEELQQRYAGETMPGDGQDDRSGVSPRERRFLRTMVEGAAPRDLQAFAERWQMSSMLVLGAWKAVRDDEKIKALPDESQETLRLALIGPGGVLVPDLEVAQRLLPEIADRIAALDAERLALEGSTPAAIAQGIVVSDGKVEDMPVFIRGDHTNPAEGQVPRGALTVLEDALDPPTVSGESSGRLELAGWITDAEHPLTARTMVNRLWNWHFGRGLVSTPSNFGLRGGVPTHPELLDWMARRFVADGWSIKSMHRLILNSSTYRMSGAMNAKAMEVDPGNTLWWHFPRRRLEAESIRDAIFAVGGSLDRSIGGSLLKTGNFGYVTNDQSASNERYVSTRRALYLPVIRNDMYSMFSTFDYTDPSVSLGSRPSTLVAPQALFMMNSPMVGSQAENLARQILEKPDRTSTDRVNELYETCFARSATPGEIAKALAFIERAEQEFDPAPAQIWPPGMEAMAEERQMIDPRLHAWRSLCKVLIASDEFIYVH